MGDLYLVDMGGDPGDRERRAAEAERARGLVRARYRARVMDQADLDEITAELVMAALFDHFDHDGERCDRHHHPTLPAGGEYSHDAGFDCPCTWDQERREVEKTVWLARLREWDQTPAARQIAAAHQAEDAAISVWVDAHHGVEAERITTACPEQWRGVIDGHSFYFRERGGLWHIEVDLGPDGRIAQRLVGGEVDGSPRTEPVVLTSGAVIATGAETQLGEGPVEHLDFILTTIRDHLTRVVCTHQGAERFCPTCGTRTH